MFASVLREVTGYFDRRVLISTFFPVLVFLGGTVLVVWVTVAGVDGAVAAWGRRPVTVQAVVIAGFLVLTAFLTFVVGNLREWQDRVCQGYWPDRVAEPFARRHRAARRALLDRDDALRAREEALALERRTFPRHDVTGPTTLTSVDDALRRLGEVRAGGEWPEGTSELLADVARAARISPVAGFTDLVFALDERLAAAEQQVRDERAEVQQELFLWYPQPPRDVLPTRMGNVVRAAELHPSVRYRLDAVVLWTRLQPLLPKEFDDAVKDAKVSVDLLLTMAAFLPLFGTPLSWWLAFRLQRIPGTPAAWLTVAAVLVCVYAVVRLVPRWWQLTVAVGVYAVVHVLVGFWTPLLRVEVGLVWTVAAFTVAYGLYRNATRAALAWTERLRTAFDLYRWKLLDELRLPLPEDLKAERAVWAEVSQFLYRGATTNPDTMRYRHPATEDGGPTAGG
ncbi:MULTISPECIES: hypothetical protein [unclassified Saccharothrix]|uniref:hypothetical protein n=1 Tax=unclassified Saccharothrix TaxID=2593673 RepID=UPI00307E804D